MTNAGIFKDNIYDYMTGTRVECAIIKPKASGYSAIRCPGVSTAYYRGRENKRIAPPTMTSWKS